jgi:nucleoside-diphosphate-sugar epimerase
MKILLTGASSGIGSALIRRLVDNAGLEIKAMVHRSLVNIAGCEARQGDLDNPESLARAVDGVDTVVHMAALTTSARESEYIRTNVAGTKNLMDACILTGVKRIIYISSRAASLDGGGYSRSKLEAEECVKSSGLQWLILRPSEVYGLREDDTINRLIQWVKKYPFVPVIGKGQARLSPVYIEDVVSAMECSILDKELESETILLAGPEELTFNELVDRIAKYFGVRRFKLHLPSRLVKFGAMVLTSLGVKLVVPDQIPRLLCSKDMSFSKSSELISYSPRKLEEGINAYWKD